MGVCVGVDDIALVGVLLGVGVKVQSGEITSHGLFVITTFPVAPVTPISLTQYPGENVVFAAISTFFKFKQQSLNETAIL